MGHWHAPRVAPHTAPARRAAPLAGSERVEGSALTAEQHAARHAALVDELVEAQQALGDCRERERANEKRLSAASRLLEQSKATQRSMSQSLRVEESARRDAVARLAAADDEVSSLRQELEQLRRRTGQWQSIEYAELAALKEELRTTKEELAAARAKALLPADRTGTLMGNGASTPKNFATGMRAC